MAVISNGTTIMDAGAISVGSGKMILIKTLTASGSANLSFVHGASSVVLDNTYDSYVFKFTDIHAATDDVFFTFGGRDGDTNYDATKTTTAFGAYNNEGGNDQALFYSTARDLAQSTDFQSIMVDSLGIGNDESAAGELVLYSPASTTFVKHFSARTNHYQESNYNFDSHVAGYFNVTAAIDGIQFKMSSGNFDGVIKLYGIGG